MIFEKRYANYFLSDWKQANTKERNYVGLTEL